MLEIESSKRITYDKNKCILCGACAAESEYNGIRIIKNKIIIDEEAAEDWENIITICPVGAINWNKTAGDKNCQSSCEI